MRKLQFLFIALGLAQVGLTQTLFYDDFEDREYGFFQAQGPEWYGFTYPDDVFPYPFPKVVGATTEASPYSGNKMYEVRGSSTTSAHVVFSNFDGSVRQDFGSEFSVKVWLSPIIVPGQALYVALNYFEGGSAGFQLNKSTNSGLTFGVEATTLSTPNLRLGAWNDLRLRTNRLTNDVEFRLNGSLIFSSKRKLGDMKSILTYAEIGLSQNEDVTNMYDRATGTPGIYVDNYHTYAVPEPCALVCVALGSILLFKRRS